jgi:NTE family protein
MNESKRLPAGVLRRNRGVALALQGGGAHGAFTWGVLDRLLEDGLEVGAISGVSSGAIIGAMLVQGLVRGGAAGARAELARLWERVGQARGAMAGIEDWFWSPGPFGALAWQGMEAMLRVFGPAHLNPFGHNPLRPLLGGLLDCRMLADPAATPLYVAATDVETGVAVVFDNAAIDVDVLLASACLPLVFPPMRIGGRAFWDGGCAGNPPLGPLLGPEPPEELLVIRAQPTYRAGTPSGPAEIMNRLNEIASHNVLQAELALVPETVRLRVFDADAVLRDLPASSKFRADPGVLRILFTAGRAAAEGWIAVPAPARI